VSRTEPTAASGHRRVALAVLSVANSLVVLDGLIVAVALPAIQDALGFGPADLQWVVNAYVLCFGGGLLVGGRLGDLVGRRRVAVAGLLVFAAGSLLAGLAPSAGWLVAGRALQGTGAAVMDPALLALLITTFPERAERNRALGAWSAAGSLGIPAGALLGGLLTSALGWRWVLLATAPVALLAAFVVVERRSPAPLVPSSIFRVPGLVAADLAAATLPVGLGALLFVGTLHLQQVLGYTALRTGLAYLALSLPVVAASPAAACLVTRLGRRSVAVAGLLLQAAGLLLLLRITPGVASSPRSCPGSSWSAPTLQRHPPWPPASGPDSWSRPRSACSAPWPRSGCAPASRAGQALPFSVPRAARGLVPRAGRQWTGPTARLPAGRRLGPRRPGPGPAHRPAGHDPARSSGRPTG
jgi:MFS family permease